MDILISYGVQIAGLVIIAIVVLQIVVLFTSSLTRIKKENSQLDLSIKLLETKLEAARVEQFKQEQATLTWNGFRKFVVKRKVYEGKNKPKKNPYLIQVETGKEYELKEEMKVGRLKDGVDISIPHNTVSGTHAKITMNKNKEIFMEDLLSTNGSRINNEPAQPQVKLSLKHDDIIHFGEIEFKLQIPSASIKPRGGDINSFYLTPHDGKPLPSFEPGQYLTFQFKIPGQARPVIRCYSLSDAPNPDYYRISVKRDFKVFKGENEDGSDRLVPGLSSNFLHDLVEEGDIIDVKAPGGKFYLDMNRQKPIVLIGGGIGITPVLSMVNTIINRKDRRETWFFFGCSTGDDHVFRQHLEAIGLEHENIRVNICYSRPKPEDVKGRDYHHHSRVNADLFKEVLPSNNYDYYMCGPGPMMESIVKGLTDWGVPEKDIYYEAFGPASVKSKKKKEPKAEAKADSGASFTVNFSKSGKEVKWMQGSETTILELAEENGVVIDFGCRAGNCGTCVTAVKSGEVDNADAQPEDGTCFACVGTPKSNIVLDA